MPKLATPLTEAQISELKPRAKRYKIGDGHGLCLLIEPTGIKRWHMVYKRQGMETSLRLGTYPEILLSEARLRHTEAQLLIADGIDPSEKRREQRQQEQSSRPKFRRFHLPTNEQGGLVIENHINRMTLGPAQVKALTAFLIATPVDIVEK